MQSALQKHRMGWVLAILGVSLLSGCAPPDDGTNGSAYPDNGRAVVKVNPKSPGAFETRLIDGVEYRIARGPLGKPGGTFYENQLGEGPKTFNPWASYDATSSTLGGMLVASLLDTDAYTGEMIPYLAREYEISADQKTYTLRLRQGLTWSDGHPLTADDVVFTWDRIIGAGLGNASTRDNLLVAGQFPVVRKIDALTVAFTTAEPFSPFLRQMGGVNIAPRHIFEPIIAKGGDKAFSAAWGTSQALKQPAQFVSSGMWRLQQYEPGQQVTYQRNPRFFMRDRENRPLPYLDRYVIRFAKDMNNLQLQFEQGKVDVYGVSARFLAHVRQLKKPDFTLADLGPASSTTFVTFNLSRCSDAQGRPLVDPVRSRWFNNVHFRRAVDWAINREAMVQNILLGVGSPLFTAESLSSLYLNPKLAKGHPRDLEIAKKHLREGGFHWKGETQLVDADNHPVEFTLYTNTGNDQREASGVSIKQDLSKLGIKVNFKPMDFNVLVGKMNTGEWEAIVMGLTGSPLDPHSGFNVWRSSGSLHLFNQRDPKAPASALLPWEKQIDDLFIRGARTFDKAERQRIYHEYQQVVYDNLPFIYLYSPTSIVAARSRVRNFDPTPLATLHNLESIWIGD